MNDVDPNNITQFAPSRDKGPSKDLKEQIGEAGAEMKQRAGDALQATADLARDKFSEAADAAKGVTEGTVEQIRARPASSSGRAPLSLSASQATCVKPAEHLRATYRSLHAASVLLPTTSKKPPRRSAMAASGISSKVQLISPSVSPPPFSEYPCWQASQRSAF